VQRRLSEEYRYLAERLREQFEEVLLKESAALANQESRIRSQHVDDMKALAVTDVDLVVEPPILKAPSTTAVEVLERKICGGDDPSSHCKRVAAFWKARYQAAVKQLQELQTSLILADAQLAQQVELKGVDAKALESIVHVLRDAEGRERKRCDDRRQQYLDECVRRGVEPSEISEVIPQVELQPMPGATDRRVITATSSGSALLSVLIDEKTRDNNRMHSSIREVEERLNSLSARCEESLYRLSQRCGMCPPHTFGLMEELVQLHSEAEVLESKRYAQQRESLRAKLDVIESLRQARTTLELESASHRRSLMNLEEEARKLDVSIVSIRGGGAKTSEEMDAEFGLLQSRILLAENGNSALRSELRELLSVQANLEQRVDSILRSQRSSR
jgi:hypothetical protein